MANKAPANKELPTYPFNFVTHHALCCCCCRCRFIKERDLDWSYWPLDGQQGPSRKQGVVESYGLLNKTWNGWAYTPLLQQLQELM